MRFQTQVIYVEFLEDLVDQLKDSRLPTFLQVIRLLVVQEVSCWQQMNDQDHRNSACKPHFSAILDEIKSFASSESFVYSSCNTCWTTCNGLNYDTIAGCCWCKNAAMVLTMTLLAISRVATCYCERLSENCEKVMLFSTKLCRILRVLDTAILLHNSMIKAWYMSIICKIVNI